MADLSVLVNQESTRLRDFVYGANRFVASTNDRSAGLLENPLHLTDTVAASLNLEVNVSESLRLREFVYGASVLAPTNLSTGLMENPLHAGDALGGIPTIDPEIAVPSESVRVIDFVYGAAVFVESQNTKTSGQMENPLHLGDGPVNAIMDLYVAVAQESLKIADIVKVPTRIYFPSAGPSPLPTLGFDAAWQETATAVRRGILTGNNKRGTAAASVTVTSTATSPEQHLAAQYVSPPLMAQTIAGSIRGQFRALESNANFNGNLQIGIRVVSKDGATVRATLLAVTGSTNNAATPPELTTALTNRQVLNTSDATPLSLSSYTCVEGDRLVIEVGVRDVDSGAVRTADVSFGDNTVDLQTDDTTTTANDPWLEFNSILLFETEFERLKIADTVAAGIDLFASVATENLKLDDKNHGVVQLIGVLHIKDGPVLADLAATVTFDAASTSPYEVALSSYSFNHTVGDHTNRALVIGVGVFATGSVSGVTFNGVAATFVRADTNGIYRSEVWVLAAPDIGEHSVAVTLSASLTSIANAASYYNADQSAPVDAHNGGNGISNPASASVTPVASNDTVVGILATKTPSGVTSAAGQRSRTSNTGALGTVASDDHGDAAGATTLTWNGITALDSWAVSLVALKPFSAAGGDLSRALSDENLKLADSVQADENPRDIFGLTEALKLTDTVTASRDLTTSLQEDIRLADTVAADENPRDVSVAAENLKLADTLTAARDLTASLQEDLKLADGPPVGDENPRPVLVAQEALRLADTVAAARDLEASPSEALKLSDAVTAASDRLIASLSDDLRLADTLQAQLDTLQQAASESLKLADTVVASRDLDATLAEALKLADTAQAARDVETVVAEALRLADAVSASRDLSVSLTEACRLSDADLTALMLASGSVFAAEVLHLVDSVQATLDPLEAAVSEVLALADAIQTGRAFGAISAIHFTGETLSAGAFAEETLSGSGFADETLSASGFADEELLPT